jgi:hypothetical protein
VTREGTITERGVPILRDLWRELIAEGDFPEAAYRERVFIFPLDAPADRQLFVCRVRIRESDFEAWAADRFPREDVRVEAFAKKPNGNAPATQTHGRYSTSASGAGLSDLYPGRPSIKPQILEKWRERAAAKLDCDTLAAEARWLYDWAQGSFVSVPGLPSTPRVIENQIRTEYRNLHPISSKEPH